MITRYPKTLDQDDPKKENITEEVPVEAGNEADCRCKEASTMTPRELLKLMISDLALWKKKA
jgi:hypothetical protein